MIDFARSDESTRLPELALGCLADGRPRTLEKIQQAMGLAKNRVTRVLGRLVDEGRVLRQKAKVNNKWTICYVAIGAKIPKNATSPKVRANVLRAVIAGNHSTYAIEQAVGSTYASAASAIRPMLEIGLLVRETRVRNGKTNAYFRFPDQTLTEADYSNPASFRPALVAEDESGIQAAEIEDRARRIRELAEAEVDQKWKPTIEPTAKELCRQYLREWRAMRKADKQAKAQEVA